MTPLICLAVVAGILGLVIGSFLNVVAHRVPAGASLSPASRCPQCHHAIAWRHNVPVLGWVALRGRCADCDVHIPARYPLVEAFTGLAFAAVVALWWHRLETPGTPGTADWVVLVAYAYFAAVGIALTLIDLDVRRLPDVIVLPSYLVGGLLLTLACVLGAPWERLALAGIGALVLWGFYALVRLVRPDGMGGGDVKLAGLVGGFLGWVGWGALAVGAFAAFLLGGVFGLGLLLVRRSGRRTTLPFGPWILAGAWAGIWVGQPVGHAYWQFAGM